MIKVIFTYCDEEARWEISITGVESVEQAKRAFTSVVFACEAFDAESLIQTKIICDVDKNYVVEASE